MTDAQGNRRARGTDAIARLRAAAVRADLEALAVECSPRLEVIGSVGTGGTGQVDAVLDRVLRRKAAKKSLREQHEQNPRSVRRFVREARITSQLDHPGIVPVHDLGVDPTGRLFFTLKLVEGHTLSQILDGWRSDGVEEAALLDVLDALITVCDALSLAHSRGVVHCDVKPENIMIGDYGAVYLMDWGSALVLEDPELGPSPGAGSVPSLPGDSRDDTVSGTPSYMAPEQANVEIERIGPHTDVFGIGATLYEILAGRAPYTEHEELLTLELASEARYTPLADMVEMESVPPLLAQTVSRAMARDIDERYPDVDALKADLVRYVRGGDTFPAQTFEPGTVVVREGDEGDRAFIINRGQCEVIKDIDGAREVVRTLGPGEVFGETALLSPGPRTASVVAVGTVIVQVIRGDVLTQELGSVRPWLHQLLRTVAARFREADAKLARGRAAHAPSAALQAAMYLHTFGAATAAGDLEGSWSALCRGLGVGAERLQAELEADESFAVDAARDRVTLSSPQETAARLAAEASG